MRIHAVTTGTVRLKHAFLVASAGWRRQLDLFLPGPWSEPLPIHCSAVEHGDGLTLVDAGETALVRDIPFAHFQVAPEDELPRALDAAGLDIGDVRRVVLTHMHGDHMDGAVHVRGPALVHDRDLEFSHLDISVICVDDQDRHVLLAGDACSTPARTRPYTCPRTVRSPRRGWRRELPYSPPRRWSCFA
jgi:hypothetical protein